MTSIFHSSLSKDLSIILNDSDDFNVIIQVGENKNTKEFRAHSVILRARSPYFKSAFSTDWVSKIDNMITFNKPNINPSVFDMILRYIYIGELDLTEQSGEDILGLLVASDELLLEELLKHVQDYLIEQQADWVQNNLVLVLNTVFKLASCKKLQNHCFQSICEDPQPLITSKNFSSLDKDILFDLLKRDDLQIEEIVAWNYLIKWGIEQIPGLGSNKSDKTKWSDENYEALKEILSQFIPLIRFVDITSDEFFDNVRPYKTAISHQIYEEIAEFYYKKTIPSTISWTPRTLKPVLQGSTIIQPKLATIIANWIDRKNSTILPPNNKYKFNLIYLMSRDGFDYTTFYSKCDGQGPFVVLVRVQSKKIYGGYNPVGYEGRRNTWLQSNDSFIFSFENDQDTHDMKISRVVNEKNSVWEHVNYMGFFSFGYSLYVSGQNLFVGHNTINYDNIFDKDELPIEEIEVFSVTVKK